MSATIEAFDACLRERDEKTRELEQKLLMNEALDRTKLLEIAATKHGLKREIAKLNTQLQQEIEKQSLYLELKCEHELLQKKYQALLIEHNVVKSQLSVFQPQPKSFANSNFKATYSSKLLPRFQDEVFLSLRMFLLQYSKMKSINESLCLTFFEELQGEAFDYKDDVLTKSIWICMRLWTTGKTLLGKEFCSILNEAIREDLPELLSLALPLIAGLNELCVERNFRANPRRIQWPEDGLLYRGTGIPSCNQGAFTEGLKYRCPMFLATSKNKTVAQQVFCRRAQFDSKLPPVLFIIYLNKQLGCVHVNYVEKTNVEGESEFLFVPYSVFTVMNTMWKENPTWADPHIVELEAACDNQLESEDMPLIFWH